MSDIKEYILEKFEEYSQKYLEDCRTEKDYADYGDTRVVCGEYYSDYDIEQSYQIARELIEQEFNEAREEMDEKSSMFAPSLELVIESKFRQAIRLGKKDFVNDIEQEIAKIIYKVKKRNNLLSEKEIEAENFLADIDKAKEVVKQL